MVSRGSSRISSCTPLHNFNKLHGTFHLAAIVVRLDLCSKPLRPSKRLQINLGPTSLKLSFT